MKLFLLALSVGMGLTMSACASPDNGTQIAQEQRACADMGIAPGSGQFHTCVSNLDQTRSDAQHVGSD